MRIAYLVHDLSDPAVAVRTAMLRAGGAEVDLMGFRRGGVPRPIAGITPLEFGPTRDGRLLRRAASVLRQAASAPGWGRRLAGADVVLARNLEMLVLAAAARALHAPRARLVYECLDIHRLMLSDGPAGQALRALERLLMRQAGLLVVSSPAFVRRYFEPRQGLSAPWLLVENKVFEPDAEAAPPPSRTPGPPWRIGWYGIIRCRRSLEILTALAAHGAGRVEVVIRGRPAAGVFDDFEGQVAAAPGVTYGGPYRREDLGRLYADVHFTWAVDFYEAGGNSDWLLPNRLYEGGRHGATSVAAAGGEIAAWLESHGLGVILDDLERDLPAFFDWLDAGSYARLEAAAAAAPAPTFVAGHRDAAALVSALAGKAGKAHAPVSEGARALETRHV